jgi:hypothetical protein
MMTGAIAGAIAGSAGAVAGVITAGGIEIELPETSVNESVKLSEAEAEPEAATAIPLETGDK